MKNIKESTVQLGYNDFGLYNTSAITSYMQWYQLIPQKVRVFLPYLIEVHNSIYIGYNGLVSYRFQ
jgi:hypothetical protein